MIMVSHGDNPIICRRGYFREDVPGGSAQTWWRY